jgi:hypothetical protein
VLLGYEAATGQRQIVVPGLATFSFCAAGGVDATPAVADLEDTIHDVWVRSILPLVLQSRGTQVLHCSAFVKPNRSFVALCGRTRAGKSTLAAALMQRRGLRIAADDALPFTARAPGAVAHPLPFRLRLRRSAAGALGLPAVAVVVGEPDPPSSIEAIVVLEPGQTDYPRLQTLTPARAFGRLMPHAYCFSFEGSKSDLIEQYTTLTDAVDVFALGYPQRLERIDEVLDALEPLRA